VSVTILDREMYTEAAAARLLRVAPSTLHWWLEGRPPRYRPVIRVEPTGSRNVTWAEFVEAGLLRSYRREHDVPLKELREFIDRLREEFQVPYPLADRRPYVGSGRRLLIRLVGALLAEQNDEWTESRRYMGLGILAACRKAAQPGMGQDITSEAGLTIEAIPA
jgi:hypothetical protein